MTPGTRAGTSSPLLESGSRLFPKRTRELQGQTLSPSIWGPPTSGTSSPLHLIPESPSQDSFPDLTLPNEAGLENSRRRSRAGTLPGRISSMNGFGSVTPKTTASKTSRPTPSTSPFRPANLLGDQSGKPETASSDHASLLSRLRAGSMPQRSGIFGGMSPFGSSVFASNWAPRDRAATLTNLVNDDPTSPTQAFFQKEGMTDTSIRTLDYLGLVETPQPSKATPNLAQSNQSNGLHPFPDVAVEVASRSGNRFRSFSVNAPGAYNDSKDDGWSANSSYNAGTISSSAVAAIEAEYEAVQEKVRLHNLAVQDFARNASAARPRARTAGIIEAPQRAAFKGQNKAPSPISSQMDSTGSNENFELIGSFQNMDLGQVMGNAYDGFAKEDSQPSRSLYIGNIPSPATTSSLDAVFGPFGTLESTRILSHKNCAFVNFENIDDAIQAKHFLNGKEIFPGSGAVRIGFAKVPVLSQPAAEGYFNPESEAISSQQPVEDSMRPVGLNLRTPKDISNTAVENAVRLSQKQADLLDIAVKFGASQTDLSIINATLQSAINYQRLESEIPPVVESNQARVYDAPRLRDIRKRIDNGSCSVQEVEQIAIDMLPEIAELASDYLGNTVVQKLFEFCNEQTKEQMLPFIAPSLAEIGIHKNGTWAAQKIIDVCKTPSQMAMIVENLRPYTVPLILDQYGNYVLQCCLRFGAPFTDFIFETMLTHMDEIAAGRFGARAMRACLESHHATKHQQQLLAAAISLNVVHLAKNANSALLLTWLLDTCNFPSRRIVLAPQLKNSLVEMCTHKVSYLTVLKVINQRNEPAARDMILEALFFSPGNLVLEEILSDQSSGATLVFKILTTPFFDEDIRAEVVRNISLVLTKIKAQPGQGYKRLMDEVGLSSRPSYNQPLQRNPTHHHLYSDSQPRPMSQPTTSNFVHPSMPPRQYSGSYLQTSNVSNHHASQTPPKPPTLNGFGYPSYAYNNLASPSMYPNMMAATPPSLAYNNFNLMNPRGGPEVMSPAAMNAFSGYATPPGTIETMRGYHPQQSPLPPTSNMSPMLGTTSFTSDSYGQPFQGNYGYQQSYFPQQIHSSGRGRRVRSNWHPSQSYTDNSA